MSNRSSPLIASAWGLASIGIATAVLTTAYRNYKNVKMNSDTDKIATSSVNDPFSAKEWQFSARSRSQSEDDLVDEENLPQRPVAHSTMGGLANTLETIALVMVGVPGRGKTAVASRTARYLKFFHGMECEVFNVGDRRRESAGFMSHVDYNFTDEEANNRRKHYSDLALNQLKLFLLKPGRIGIFDASNVTPDRRLNVYSELKKLGKINVIFVELISSETMVDEKHMASLDSDGASGVENLIEDYHQRVNHYLKVYEPVASGPPNDIEHSYSYIKCIDHGKQVELNKIDGYMPGRIAQFITNCCHCYWNSDHKKLYLSRHGQSEYNAAGRIGGDSDLTEMGEKYALALRDFAVSNIMHDPKDPDREIPCRLWTSTLKRTRNTARHIPSPTIMVNGYPWVQMLPRVFSNLDEIYAAACDGMTYANIEERFAKEAALRKKDKLSYRYPRGESYLDVIQRLEPLIQEIERHRESLLIVGHQGVLRMVYAFYAGIDRNEAPHQELKLNHVTILNPTAYGCGVEVINLLKDDIPCDDGQKKH
jgi:broad specificity phosphatase PhoE/predicted kinase